MVPLTGRARHRPGRPEQQPARAAGGCASEAAARAGVSVRTVLTAEDALGSLLAAFQAELEANADRYTAALVALTGA